MKHIRILSPSGAIDPTLIFQAKSRLEAWGFMVSIAPHALGKYGRFAATDQERLLDLNEAFADPSVDIILCSRGGYGLQQIIDRVVLPMRSISQWPLVVGFSDITALHSLMSLHGVPSLHASMCKALATLPDESEVLNSMRRALMGENVNPSSLTGTPIVGGNLSVLYGLQGTPYSLNAIIDKFPQAPMLLIEDIGERHYHIDRMLNNLRLSGVLERLSGVIIGQFTDCADDAAMQCSLRETIAQVLCSFDYPVIWDAPYGHEEVNMPIFLSKA